jgi:hypothetical protein
MEVIKKKKYLQNVIDYLNGKIDLYNGQYKESIQVWDNVWDEMKWMGYNPESAKDINKYILEQL